MIIHSVVPPELIMAEDPKNTPKTECIKANGAYLECIKDGSDYTISRLISTDPKMYLNKNYAPGQKYKKP